MLRQRVWLVRAWTASRSGHARARPPGLLPAWQEAGGVVLQGPGLLRAPPPKAS